MDKTIINNIIKLHEGYHEEKPEMVVSCGGRFEILGNHTDHNHGLCLASACDLEIIATIKGNKSKIVNLKSLGYQGDEIDLSNLEPEMSEKATSSGLIRGVASYLYSHGYKIGGFNAYTYSTIFKGAGVSSSAAFELLVGYIFNILYNGGKIDTLTLCKAGQYAENEYFGKKSGLLDQIGVAFGGVVSIDFKNVDSPTIEQLEFPFKDLHWVIVNTGGDHSSLNDLYSSIPLDMKEAANQMKKRFLGDASLSELELVKKDLTENQYLRAKHFYQENERVKLAIKALNEKDESSFLKLINESRISSTNLLKNMMVGDKYVGSPLEACDLILKASDNEGACKINGGGFAGSVIALIPSNKFRNVMYTCARKYGDENVKEIFVKKDGPKIINKIE